MSSDLKRKERFEKLKLCVLQRDWVRFDYLVNEWVKIGIFFEEDANLANKIRKDLVHLNFPEWFNPNIPPREPYFEPEFLTTTNIIHRADSISKQELLEMMNLDFDEINIEKSYNHYYDNYTNCSIVLNKIHTVSNPNYNPEKCAQDLKEYEEKGILFNHFLEQYNKVQKENGI